ncbi:MAG: hypothetical protein KDD64_00690 [Bdellovibrionales bacterium]|nr:hypothetical protein [Bdellovibrionales bacterium]
MQPHHSPDMTPHPQELRTPRAGVPEDVPNPQAGFESLAIPAAKLPVLTDELLKDEGLEFANQVQAAYADWGSLSSTERASRLQQVQSLISERFMKLSEALSGFLKDHPPLSAKDISNLGDDEFKEVLSREFRVVENRVNSAVQQLGVLLTALEQGPIAKGKREFNSVTGFLDDKPKLNGSLALSASTIGIGLGIWGALSTHHAFVHWMAGHGEGVLHKLWYLTSEIIGGFTLSTGVMVAAFAGAASYGMAKTLLGEARRFFNSSAHDAFIEKQKAASSLHENLTSTREQLVQNVVPLMEMLPTFYTRNNILRAEASERIFRIRDRLLEEGLSENPVLLHEREEIREMTDLTKLLGVSEFADISTLVETRDRLARLQGEDIRSIALREHSPDEQVPSRGRVLRLLNKMRRSLQVTSRSAASLFGSGEDIGMGTALAQASELHQSFDNLEHLPKGIEIGLNGVAQITSALVTGVVPSDKIEKLPEGMKQMVSGLGSEVSSLLEVAIRSGKEPETLLLDALKSGISLVNFGPDKKEGAGFGELVRYLMMPEVWRTSKWRWLGKFIPLSLVAVFKKPVILAEIDRISGNIDSIRFKQIKADIQQSESRLSRIVYGLKEVGKVLGQATIGAVGKLGVELPLRKLAHLQRQNDFFQRGVFPDFSSLVKDWFELRLRQGKGTEQELVHKLEQYGYESLATCPLSDLKKIILLAAVEFREGVGLVSGRELRKLLKYKDAREKRDWLLRQIDNVEHVKSLTKLDRRLPGLKATIEAKVARTDLGENLDKLTPQEIRAKEREVRNARLEKFITEFNSSLGAAVRATPTVVAGFQDGAVVVRNSDGTLEKLAGIELQERILGSFKALRAKGKSRSVPLAVLPGADQARANVLEAFLMTVEPQQLEAFLEIHRNTSAGASNLEKEVRFLMKNHFTLPILLGSEAAPQGGFPGLYRLGLIGDSVPPERIIQQVRRRLVRENP